MTNFINQEVDVRSFYFRGGSALKSFPGLIEWNGRLVALGEGLRYLVEQGGRTIQLFDMAGEGGLIYRLKADGSDWTLVGTRAGA